MNDTNKSTTTAIPGLAILCLFATGVAGVIHAFLTENGMSIVGAALAFGVIAYVSFKE
jgi:hypothetical protein